MPFVYGNLYLRGTKLLLFLDALYYCDDCAIGKHTLWQFHDFHAK